jgi:transketolase
LQSVASSSDKIIICEPYYSGAITFEVTEALKTKKVSVKHIGVPHKFLDNYGTLEENDRHLGLDAEGIKKSILAFIK